MSDQQDRPVMFTCGCVMESRRMTSICAVHEQAGVTAPPAEPRSIEDFGGYGDSRDGFALFPAEPRAEGLREALLTSAERLHELSQDTNHELDTFTTCPARYCVEARAALAATPPQRAVPEAHPLVVKDGIGVCQSCGAVGAVPEAASPTLREALTQAIASAMADGASLAGNADDVVAAILPYFDGVASQPTPAPLDVEDWDTIREALKVASSYPQEMEVNRERWLDVLDRIPARAYAQQDTPQYPANIAPEGWGGPRYPSLLSTNLAGDETT